MALTEVESFRERFNIAVGYDEAIESTVNYVSYTDLSERNFRKAING